MAAPYDAAAERVQLLADVDRQHIILSHAPQFPNTAAGNLSATVFRSKLTGPQVFSGLEHERARFSDFIVGLLQHHVYMNHNTPQEQVSSLLVSLGGDASERMNIKLNEWTTAGRPLSLRECILFLKGNFGPFFHMHMIDADMSNFTRRHQETARQMYGRLSYMFRCRQKASALAQMPDDLILYNKMMKCLDQSQQAALSLTTDFNCLSQDQIFSAFDRVMMHCSSAHSNLAGIGFAANTAHPAGGASSVDLVAQIATLQQQLQIQNLQRQLQENNAHVQVQTSLA